MHKNSKKLILKLLLIKIKLLVNNNIIKVIQQIFSNSNKIICIKMLIV